jgi:hypothetical protein
VSAVPAPEVFWDKPVAPPPGPDPSGAPNLLITAYQRPIECQAVAHEHDHRGARQIVELRLVNQAAPYRRRTVRVCTDCLQGWESGRRRPAVWVGGLVVEAEVATTEQTERLWSRRAW